MRFSRPMLTLPAVGLIGLVGALPLVLILIYSFLKPASYGGVQWIFSTTAYQYLLFKRDILEGTLIFSPDILMIFVRSIGFALFTTLFCLVIGFPTAYYMATRSPRVRNYLVLLVTIPFWSNLLVRTLAIMFVIRDEGLINTAFINYGIISKPMTMLFTDGAIVLGLVYTFLPFMILPLYATLEKMDFRLVEAGLDLYATRGKVLRKVIIPIAKPGIVAGSLLVFIPALGAYVTPLILGGGKHLMIGSLIAQQFGSGRNWPLGCAQAIVLMAGVFVALYFYSRATDGKAPHG